MNDFQEATQIKGIYQYALAEPALRWPQNIRLVYTFINIHLFESRLTVGWVKEECRIHSKIFPTLFHRHVDFYPKKYIVYHRIEVAKQLLIKTEMKVSPIALSIGFNSLSAFDNSFKTREDITPSQWREQN